MNEEGDMDSVELTKDEIKAINEAGRCEYCRHSNALHSEDFCYIHGCLCDRYTVIKNAKPTGEIITLVEQEKHSDE